MRPRLAVGLLALLLGAGGCGEKPEPTGPRVEIYPLTVTGAGDRSVVVRERPVRIAVLSTSGAQILGALGATGRVRAGPDRLLDATGHVRVPLLRSIRPDLIVASTETDEVSLSRAAEATRAPVYVAPGASILEVERAITQLGLLVDEPVEARRLVREIEQRRREVRTRLRRVAPVRVFVDAGFYATVPDHSLAGELVREAHGRNVAGRAAEGPLAPRELAELDPQVYLALSKSGVTLASLRANPRLRRISAVRNGRFVRVDENLLLPGPRVGEALAAIARALHPDAFR